MLNGVFSVGGMLIGVLFLVDRFKRKTIIIYGFAIMATLHLIIAAVDYTTVGDLKATAIWLLGALFVGVMQGSMGFITRVVLAELFPLKFRGLSMGISVFFMWIMNAVVSYLFPLLQAKLGLGPVFFIFAAINYLAILFVVFALPETSNKSLEQLEAELSANHEDKNPLVSPGRLVMIDNITLDNLHIGCKASNKAEVIAMIGAEFKAKGYVNQECVHFLLEREHQVSTFLGNGITLPHLPKSATDIILKTGIEIYQFPDGVIWDRSNVMFIAIGVIAKEKEHIDVLKEIASIFSDELIANALSLISDKHDFLKILQHNALPH